MLVSAVWTAPAVLATIDLAAQRRLHGGPAPKASELLFAGGDWLLYVLLTPPIFWLVSRWPIERPHFTRRVLLHFAFALGGCVAWAGGGTVLRLALNWFMEPAEFRTFLATEGDQWLRTMATQAISWLFMTLPFGVVVYLCVAGIAHAIRFLEVASERRVQLARVSEQLTGARLAALQAQLNPHFLFNTLNTIAVTARQGDGPATARLVEQLSELLRRTVYRRAAGEVSLHDELDLVRRYVAIEGARFPDTLRPEFVIDDSTLDAAVPSFAVQHLVENAIRHGIAARAGAGRITVGASREGSTLTVWVRDDGAGLREEDVRSGHGLENTRERLRVLHGDHASLVLTPVVPHGTLAELRLPYRPLPRESNDDGQ